jgi:hypothetical protein
MAKKSSAKGRSSVATKAPLHIKVIGIGDFGQCLLPTLCRYLNYNIKDFPNAQISLIDGGHFEERHRDRQGFAKVGPKACVIAGLYREQFPRITFCDHPAYLDAQNAGQLIQENDVVFLCVDNHQTRKLVSDRATQLRDVTIISGGCDWTEGNVLVHIRRGDQNLTPPLANKYHPEIVNPTDKHPSEVEEEQRRQLSVPQLLIMSNLIAANILAVFFNIVDERRWERVRAAPENYAELYCDLTTLTAKTRSRKA